MKKSGRVLFVPLKKVEHGINHIIKRKMYVYEKISASKGFFNFYLLNFTAYQIYQIEITAAD